MVRTGALVSLFVGATIAILLFSPVTTTVTGLDETTTVSDEIVEADVGAESELRGYQLTDAPVTVEEYNESSETWATRSQGTDYTLDRADGSIQTLEDGRIDDGARLRVDYAYQPADDTTAMIWGYAPFVLAVLLLGVLGSKL
jgi:hypothetical protein